MASSRDEWASVKVQLKREAKRGFKWARDSWRESSSTSNEKVTSSSDTQDATPTVVSNQGQVLANTDFQYDPLPGDGFIRLLTILPGDGQEAIQLQVSNVELDGSSGSYESLSYVWFVCPRAPFPSFIHYPPHLVRRYVSQIVRQIACSS